MDSDIFRYLARLEIMVFFAGYALVYVVVNFLVSEIRKKPKAIISLIKELLPYSYAVNATIFLGFIFKKIYVGYDIGVAMTTLYHPVLILFGLTALLFWLQAVRKFAVLSLIHSLVFFYFIPRDIVLKFSSQQNNDVVRNDMNILTTSLLLSIVSLLMVMLVHYLIRYLFQNKQAFTKS